MSVQNLTIQERLLKLSKLLDNLTSEIEVTEEMSKKTNLTKDEVVVELLVLDTMHTEYLNEYEQILQSILGGIVNNEDTICAKK